MTDRARNRTRRMGPFRLPMLGQHNVQNALAAIAVGVEMEIDDDTLRSALRCLPRRQAPLHQDRRSRRHHHHRRLRPPPGGDRRRAESRPPGRRARRGRGGAAASLHASPFAVQRVLRLHERRRHRIVADVYPAGEKPIGRHPRRAGRWAARPRPSQRRAAAQSRAAPRNGHAIAKPGDFVVCLGAGNITQWAADLPAELATLQAARRGGNAA